MVLVGGVVGVIGHKGGALENRISAVIKETPTELPLTMWGQSQKVPVTNQKRTLNQNVTRDGTLTSDFPASRAVSNKFQFINLPVCLVFCYSSSKVQDISRGL